LAWHHQGRTLVPYLGQIIRHLHLGTPVLFLHVFPLLHYTKKLGRMSIGESLIFGVRKT
jgi:hypothetical protein